MRVWITSAVTEDGKLVPHKGIWADTSKERASHRVASLNLPDSWLRHARMRATLVGRCTLPRTTSAKENE